MVTVKNEKGKVQDAWSKKEYDTEKEARVARQEEIHKENNRLKNKEIEQRKRTKKKKKNSKG